MPLDESCECNFGSFSITARELLKLFAIRERSHDSYLKECLKVMECCFAMLV
jgi:hypothetical protein